MTLFRNIGRTRRRPSRLSRILTGFDLEVAMERARQARDEQPPRPPQCRPPAEQRAEWWGGRGAREDDWDPCTGSGPIETGSDEKGAVQ